MSEAPKLWKDMTPEEKGALLLAHHEGKVIEWSYDLPWNTDYSTLRGGHPCWDDAICYRVKPAEPVVTESVHFFYLMNGYANVDAECGPPDTHKITLTITDGEVSETAKVEKI